MSDLNYLASSLRQILKWTVVDGQWHATEWTKTEAQIISWNCQLNQFSSFIFVQHHNGSLSRFYWLSCLNWNHKLHETFHLAREELNFIWKITENYAIDQVTILTVYQLQVVRTQARIRAWTLFIFGERFHNSQNLILSLCAYRRCLNKKSQKWKKKKIVYLSFPRAFHTQKRPLIKTFSVVLCCSECLLCVAAQNSFPHILKNKKYKSRFCHLRLCLSWNLFYRCFHLPSSIRSWIFQFDFIRLSNFLFLVILIFEIC